MQRVKKKRLSANHGKNMQARLDTDKNFIKLMNVGFDRRLKTDKIAEKETERYSLEGGLTTISPSCVVQFAARQTIDQFELSKTKAEQLEELKRKKLMQRSGFMRIIPQPFHKYIDYLVSLRKPPQQGEIRRNLAVSAVFAFITMLNARARMAFIYSFIGNIAIMSILLTRNMPQLNVPMGMDRNHVVNWSQTSFRTAMGVTFLHAISAGLTFAGFLAALPLTLSLQFRLRTSMAFSVIAAAYFTSFYEVFEEKSKAGWRWKRAVKGILSDEVQERLRQQVYGEGTNGGVPLTQEYEVDYDPQVDDYPPLPKYMDEVDGSGGKTIDPEDVEHYNKWFQDRRDARKPPIEDAPSEAPWLGGKPGLFVKNPPKWLTAAYKKNILKEHSWRDLPAKFEKDYTEFEPIVGSVGFRDKAPEWLEMFGSGIWQDKITVSRSAARAYGAYRKTMWKIDKEVKLLPCDGADKHEPKTRI